MRALGLAVVLLQSLLGSVAVAQQLAAADSSFDAIKDRILSAIVAGWDSYSICEYVDRSNKLSYVGMLIPGNELPVAEGAIVGRHFVARRQSESGGVDLSLYRIQFASNEAAARALGRIRTGKSGTVADGKVLTRYAVQLDANNMYIVRTQSFLDPAARALLEAFAKEEVKSR